jgi:pantoate--beta-alanine ligase
MQKYTSLSLPMIIISTVAEMQSAIRDARTTGKSIGCIPTMGALHAGHGSLIDASSKVHDLTVVSVFVNPTQFGPKEDFDTYPRTLDADLELIEVYGGTHVFAPSVAEMYPEGFATTIHVGGITEVLEGAHRPGHFDGVATIVTKLLEAMRPDEAYFGQKDYQQTLVVKRLVRDLFLPVKINVSPTIREDDGLAMSSRNRYLSAEERSHATSLFRALEAARTFITSADLPVHANRMEQIMQTVLKAEEQIQVEYAVAVDAETLQPMPQIRQGDVIALLISARLGTTRLIDNVVVHC